MSTMYTREILPVTYDSWSVLATLYKAETVQHTVKRRGREGETETKRDRDLVLIRYMYCTSHLQVNINPIGSLFVIRTDATSDLWYR